jgi:hypothetical protein
MRYVYAEWSEHFLPFLEIINLMLHHQPFSKWSNFFNMVGWLD